MDHSELSQHAHVIQDITIIQELAHFAQHLVQHVHQQLIALHAKML